jgi:hypothetical protein
MNWRLALTTVAALVSGAASTHPGGLNAEGCHNDRKSGGYHCHRSPRGGRVPSPSPMRSLVETSGQAFSNCAAARAVGAAPVRHASRVWAAS